ncbi:MAG TPA: beta-ketoacyl-[acyl-carrier-protein] synthase family protein [Vicinamibacteria bacterium]|jgi:3-oxoacyl-[acyl-carrier-protein] synthase II
MAWAITGVGMVSSIGANTRACFEALCNGVTGNKPLQVFEHSRFNVRRAYEIADRPQGGPDRKGRSTAWLCQAVDEALRGARLGADETRPLTVLVGTGLRELRSAELWWAEGQPLRLEELHFGGALARTAAVTGPVVTLSNACSASNFALGLAEDMLHLGQARAVIVAGSESITESMFGLADRANPLHPEWVRPFDRDRQGVVLGEGAAALVLEDAAAAEARGARPLAWLRGVGMSCDAFHETAPDPRGLELAMRDAHCRAGVQPSDIDLLMAHGTGTALNDLNELLAFRNVFGPRAAVVMITAIKSMTGHTGGPSGLMSIIAAIESMRQGRVPPTIGLSTRMPEADGLDIVAGSARDASPRMIQVDAFGFGGVNAVAVLERAA